MRDDVWRVAGAFDQHCDKQVARVVGIENDLAAAIGAVLRVRKRSRLRQGGRDGGNGLGPVRSYGRPFSRASTQT